MCVMCLFAVARFYVIENSFVVSLSLVFHPLCFQSLFLHSFSRPVSFQSDLFPILPPRQIQDGRDVIFIFIFYFLFFLTTHKWWNNVKQALIDCPRTPLLGVGFSRLPRILWQSRLQMRWIIRQFSRHQLIIVCWNQFDVMDFEY